MRNKILLHVLACGMLACTPDPKEGERSSGTVQVENEPPIDSSANANSGTTSGTKDGGTPEQMTPPDNTQSNEGSKTSGAAGQ